MNRAEWLEARKTGIGGSDAAAVLGMSPWKTNVELWEEKTGRRQDKDLSDDPCVQYGIQCEPFMREIFALDFPQYTISHEENVSLKHPDFPYLRASLDGFLEDTSTDEIGVLEIKASFLFSRADREKWEGRIPQHYFIQVLHNMNVIDAAFAVLKARLIRDWNDTRTITERHYTFRRSELEADIEYLIEREHAFWRKVETDTRPDLILPAI